MTLQMEEPIPKQLEKLVFGPRESSRGSIDRKEVSINAIRTSLRSSNPGALARPKNQFFKLFGYKSFESRFCYDCGNGNGKSPLL